MLRRIAWLILLVVACTAACTPAQAGAAFVDAGSTAGAAGRNAPLVSTVTPNVVSVWPDHGQSGDVVTITGSGFGLDPRAVRVRIGGAPVEVTSLRDTEDGGQQMEVELSPGTVSGPVSIYAADCWTTLPGAFCAQPVISGITLVEEEDDVTVLISGSNFDPLAVVYVGDAPQETQRLKTARRPHRIEATQLFVAVQPGDGGTLWVENRCPDGRRYTATTTATFRNSSKD
jgi:hypothetical protein